MVLGQEGSEITKKITIQQIANEDYLAKEKRVGRPWKRLFLHCFKIPFITIFLLNPDKIE
jgi:hypothetical protein